MVVGVVMIFSKEKNEDLLVDMIFSNGVNLDLNLNYIDDFMDSVSESALAYKDISIRKVLDLKYALYSNGVKLFEVIAERDGFKFIDVSYGNKKRELSIFLKALAEKSYS